MSKNTLIINLFAGPGCGKSTGSAWLFSQLKMKGIDCEYVSEFAKDKVWENNDEVFKCQFYITGKQAFKISRCFGKVDVIVTDSPIAIGAQYCESEKLKDAILEEFNKYKENNINFLLNRVKPYNPNGRNQTEDESKNIDSTIKEWLDNNSIPYFIVDGDKSGYHEMFKHIMHIIKPQYERGDKVIYNNEIHTILSVMYKSDCNEPVYEIDNETNWIFDSNLIKPYKE